MDDGHRSGHIVRFGVFEADLRTGELRKNGAKVSLQGQPFQVCAILLERSGELITREELRQKVWPEDTFVDFDHALNTAITKIRAALGDEADNPRFVETLPRRGYRFIAPVHKGVIRPAPPVVPEVRAAQRGKHGPWYLSLAVLILLISGIGITRFSRRNGEEHLLPIEVGRLANLPGVELNPSFSPDGNQVAFVLRGTENCGIYTTMVGGERSLRLTSDGDDDFPKWSPDGKRVAFYRYTPPQMAIYVVSALGGGERGLHRELYNPWSAGLDW